MELTNDENSFNPTPRLKSSPIPILFISFNKHDKECNYCGNEYSETLLFCQKYCKNCLLKYFKNDNIIEYLDMHIRQYNKTGPEISHFKQIIPYLLVIHRNVKKSEKY